MRDFQMQERSEDILNRVVLMRVYERKNGHTQADTVDRPPLTVHSSKGTWENLSKHCALLILSKVRVRRKILNKDKDRELVHSTTPPSEAVPLHPQSLVQYLYSSLKVLGKRVDS